jgi:hypothetical protein
MATTKTSSSRSRSRSSSSRKTTSNGSSSARSAANQGQRAAEQNVEAAAERIRDLNERIIESSKKAGNVYLDIYEKTLNSIADYQEKVGEKSQVDWVTTIANAQASFTRDLAGAYSSAARSLLK